MYNNQPYAPQNRMSGIKKLAYTTLFCALTSLSCISKTIPVTLNNLKRMERKQGNWLVHHPIVENGYYIGDRLFVVEKCVGMDNATGKDGTKYTGFYMNSCTRNKAYISSKKGKPKKIQVWLKKLSPKRRHFIKEAERVMGNSNTIDRLTSSP